LAQIFWRKYFGAKGARKMLMKLTPARIKWTFNFPERTNFFVIEFVILDEDLESISVYYLQKKLDRFCKTKLNGQAFLEKM